MVLLSSFYSELSAIKNAINELDQTMERQTALIISELSKKMDDKTMFIQKIAQKIDDQEAFAKENVSPLHSQVELSVSEPGKVL